MILPKYDREMLDLSVQSDMFFQRINIEEEALNQMSLESIANISLNPSKVIKSVRRLITYMGQVFKQIIQFIVDLGRTMVRVIQERIKPITQYVDNSRPNVERFLNGEFGTIMSMIYGYNTKNPAGTIVHLNTEIDMFNKNFYDFVTNKLEDYLRQAATDTSFINRLLDGITGGVRKEFAEDVFGSRSDMPTLNAIGKLILRGFGGNMKDVSSIVNQAIYGGAIPYKKANSANATLVHIDDINLLNKSSLVAAKARRKALETTARSLRRLANTMESAYERPTILPDKINKLLGEVRMVGALAFHLPNLSWNIYYNFRNDLITIINDINSRAAATNGEN